MDLSRTVDIDNGRELNQAGIYVEPNQTLAKIVESLPHLKYLDISGTNLAGTGALPTVTLLYAHVPLFLFIIDN